MTRFSYEKWEATGNDFVLVDLASNGLSLADFNPALVRRLCHRKLGVGADGVVLLKLDESPARMTIINADGSPSGMCGNALRCVAQVLARRSDSAGGLVLLGERTISTRVDDSRGSTVVLGPAQEIPGRELWDSLVELNDTVGAGYMVWFGNPHNVVLVDEIPKNWAELGEKSQEIAHRHLGMGGINCGFLEREPRDGIHQLRVYERGVGVTQSCGSGACAASAVLEGVLGLAPPHRLALPGGVLTVDRQEQGYALSGPADLEFVGEWSS